MRKIDLMAPGAAVLLLFGAVTGCGEADDAPDVDEVAEMPFDVATAGNVQGMIMFEGTPPDPVHLDMASEPECDAHWDGEAMREDVRVRDGHLANVFVYVKEGLEGMQFPRTRQAALIDQLGCRYTPHVSGVMPGQTVTFKNSDPVMHNINATPSVNRPFNFSQPAQNMENDRTFAQPEVMIPVRCDVHGWMRAYIGVVPHPYHAVSGDAGTFDLSELPPGEYVIEAWHARLGTQEQTVTVATGETAQVSFTFTEEMLETAVVPLGDPIDPHNHNPFLHRAGSSDGSGHSHGSPATSGR
jgi:plastocyanin